MTQRAVPRMIGIDLARSVAILLAMTSHVLTVCHSAAFFSDASLNLLRPLLHAATPTFIVLFGSMLAIVYLPRFDERPHEITARLISRAVQCWILYALSVAVLYLTDPGYSLSFSISTLALVGVTPFTDILKFYTVALLASPLLLAVMRRHGVVPLLTLSVLVHLARTIARTSGVESVGPELDIQLPQKLDRLSMFLFGVGDGALAGPSVLHGLTFVVFGMALSGWLASSRTYHTWILLAAAAALLTGIAASQGPAPFTHEAMSLRQANAPLYFVIGICSACILACLATFATRCIPDRKTWTRLTFFGRTSLFTFAFGNMLLYCVPVDPRTHGQALFWTIALTGTIGLLSFTFDRATSHEGFVAQAMSAIRRSLDRLCTTCVQRAFSSRPGSS